MADILDRLKTALQDRYTIERELGSGGMARVYLAQDLKHDRQVALKVLRPELGAAVGSDRFTREIKIAAKLSHPHILPLHDSGEAADTFFYVMPYVEGESLRDRLEREGELPVDEALRIACEVADALAYAHSQGVVHRDIKPDNVMLSSHHVLVADFGVAKAVLGEEDGGAITTAGLAVGTPAYMAPEQAAADPRVDHRADIYALGVMMYEMLTGEPPFTAKSAQALLAAHLADSPVPLIERRPSVPLPVSDAVMRCLAKRAADRWQSADDVRSALSPETTSSATSVAARPASARGGVKRWVAMATVAVVALIGVWLVGGRSATPTLQPNLVAIVPFDVVGAGTDLDVWREGMVSLLSRHFDGAGSLRSVSPNVIVRNWDGSASATAASQLATRVGAGLVVFGSLYATGEDSVRLAATLWNVATDQPVVEGEWRGPADHVDWLADSIAVRFLAARSGGDAVARRTPLGSRSPMAVKEFLRGEELARQARYREAIPHFERAIAADSMFALAYHALGSVRGWEYFISDAESARLQRRAGELNHGLAPRDSLLILIDSVATGGVGPHFETRWRLARLVAQVRNRYPDDPQLLFAVGEAELHFLHVAGVPLERPLEAFERAIALDPLFADPYEHAIEMGMRFRSTDRVLELIKGARAIPDLDLTRDSALAILEAMLSARDEFKWRSALETASPDVLGRVAFYLQFSRDSVGFVLAVAEQADESAMEQSQTLAYGVFWGLSARGQLDSFERMGWRSRPLQVLLGDAVEPEDEAQIERLVAQLPSRLLTNNRNLGRWFAERLTESAITHDGYIERLLPIVDSVASASDTAWLAAMMRDKAEYLLALAEGDTVGVAARLLAHPDSLRFCAFCGILESFVRVRVLASAGELDAAARFLRRRGQWYGVAEDVLWHLERARVADRRGDTETAVDAYDFVVTMWRDADERLQPYVEEARQALIRLSGEATDR